MRTVYGDHERFIETYFSTYPGNYFTGDGCRRDEDGYYWITGRVDDVINVSGHRMGTAESNRRWCCTTRSPRPPWLAIRTISRARASMPTSR
jgi:acyl-coenzyme A synthetase/AMP-(fatty) acid ligase